MAKAPPVVANPQPFDDKGDTHHARFIQSFWFVICGRHDVSCRDQHRSCIHNGAVAWCGSDRLLVWKWTMCPGAHSIPGMVQNYLPCRESVCTIPGMLGPGPRRPGPLRPGGNLPLTGGHRRTQRDRPLRGLARRRGADDGAAADEREVRLRLRHGSRVGKIGIDRGFGR